jgi:addiction module HigA family antidote
MLREEFLPDFGWTPDELASRLRVAPEVIMDLLAERTKVTPELALRLGRLFRQTPAMWIKLQLAHDFHAALATADVELIEPVPPPQPVRKAS